MTTTTADHPAPPVHTSGSVRDLATRNGTYTTVRTTIGNYLAGLNLFDPSTRMANWDASVVHVDFQRAAIDIKKNAVKRTMLRDLMRGGTVPPTVLAAMDHDEPRRPLIIDGLQRTHVGTISLISLLRLARGEPIDDFVRAEIEAIKQIGQRVLSVDEFLSRPFEYQLWQNLEPQELVRLFILLNAGQQKVSPRHLLEVMGAQLREMFRSWGLQMLTQREHIENPRRRSRRRGADLALLIDLDGDGAQKTPIDRPIEGVTHYRFEFLLDGLCAYIARNPHVKTSTLLQDSADTARLSVEERSIEERITEIGDEVCKADFLWVCRDLNRAIQEKYASDPTWEYAIQTSDNFTFPLLAALGAARFDPAFEQQRPALEDRKAKLIQVISNGGDDPLGLVGDAADHLAGILSRINSNIGRRRRAIVYGAFRRYFRHGAQEGVYPVDWYMASLD